MRRSLPLFLLAATLSSRLGAQIPRDAFPVGEKMQFEVKFGILSVGRSTLETVQIDTIRGRQAIVTRFEIRGGTIGYRLHDIWESWIEPRDFVALRFKVNQSEGGYKRNYAIELYPERQVYFERDSEQTSVAEPLDETGFLQFVRTVPLETGKTYDFNRYYRPDRNPVRLIVKRRERIKVPAGTFDAVVVQPVIKAKGLFSEGGRAEVWLSDDSRRLILKLNSKLSVGSLTLNLKSYTGAPEASTR